MGSKILFVLCVAWIVFCLLVFTIGQIIPYTFANEERGDLFYGMLWITLPLSIVFTLISNINPVKSKAVIFIIAILSFLIGGFFVFDRKMCGTTKEIAFINKWDTKVKVIRTSQGCGAHDSEAPSIHFFKIVPFGKYFFHKTEVDTSKLDKTIWRYALSE